MKGAVKRNTSLPTGRPGHNINPWQPAPASVERSVGFRLRQSFRWFIGILERCPELKSDKGHNCRPRFYLSLEGYCFSRSCEGG